MDSLKKVIADNLVELRKMKKYTQQDLGNILQYSDKAISKWEKGESLPDIEVLYEICELYGVTLDFLTHPGAYSEKKEYIVPKYERRNKIMITLLSCSFIWLACTLAFIYLNERNKPFWPIFVWGLPSTCLVLLFYNHRWGRRSFILPIISVFIWTLILSIFLTGIYDNNSFWQLFFVGIPCQVVFVLWSQIKRE